MNYDVGKMNYEKYKETVGGKTMNGDYMKKYEELPERIKKAWNDAAEYVIFKFNSVYL